MARQDIIKTELIKPETLGGESRSQRRYKPQNEKGLWVTVIDKVNRERIANGLEELSSLEAEILVEGYHRGAEDFRDDLWVHLFEEPKGIDIGK